LAILFVVFFYLPWHYSKTISFVLFVIASITDYLDGKIARKVKGVSRLGMFIDPLADKILILGAFVCFVDLKIIPAWMVIVILSREFLITGLRIYGLTLGQHLPAIRIAKHKTISQITSIYLILSYLVLQEWGVIEGLNFHFQTIILGFMYLVVFFTIVSGVSYVYHNRELFYRR
jgi:CDP-diacylglycerol--glycerol-3-phosphate 3-phosphatidyltransferase